MIGQNNSAHLTEVLEAIAERDRRPARCLDCGSTDLLDPLDDLDSDGEVRGCVITVTGAVRSRDGADMPQLRRGVLEPPNHWEGECAYSCPDCNDPVGGTS